MQICAIVYAQKGNTNRDVKEEYTMNTAIIGICLIVIFGGLALFLAVREYRKMSKIKADKKAYEKRVQSARESMPKQKTTGTDTVLELIIQML